MSGPIPLLRFDPRGGRGGELGTFREGNIVWVTLYDANGNEVGSSDPVLHLEWRPAWKKTCDDGTIGGWLRGTDSPDAAPLPPPGVQRALTAPIYPVDLAPHWCATAGDLVLVVTGVVAKPELYVAVTQRKRRKDEPPPRSRYTVYFGGGAPLVRPRGAWGVSAPNPLAVDLRFKDSLGVVTTRTVTLPASGEPFPVLGAVEITPSAAGFISWEMAR